ncbi:apolipoprotein N-acyltransferase [Phytohalomonas tamaricis]|uniref:apolipoprotein N-acyltransferase n=1 Tax=Phytohalomonas tamaricis TaxID=2081032 RepID=UPI000D0AE2D5|nr:apolipoprotein N-acyltransferase [Phytohalomonas tamaricis]
MTSLLERPWVGHMIALVAGALTTLTFAPFDQWWLGPLSIALLYGSLAHTSVRTGAFRGWWFGVGLFATGTSWVYVSIHDFGNTGAVLAGLLTVLMALGLALFYAIAMAIYRLVAPSRLDIIAFAGVWTLGEAFRSWALTGFPWLYLGSAHVDSPIASLAPLGGVYLLSLVVALSGALLWHIVAKRQWLLVAPLLALWLVPLLLPKLWATPSDTPVSVSLVQGNLAQLIKWTAEGQRTAANTYAGLTREQSNDAELVIWPETALPMFEDQARPFLERMQSTLSSNTALLTGIVQRDDTGHYYNSVISVGASQGEYKKEHLVPFGEYLPLESTLRGIIGFFDLPMSSFGTGNGDQPPLLAHGLRLGVAICYEIVYPDLVRQRAKDANVLLTVSNDTWFGHSIGPLQHMQMARLRALENNRYLLRATNNGMTAIVSPRGEIIAHASRFEKAVLNGEVRAMAGETPFTRTGSLPTLLLACLMAVVGLIFTRRERNKH